MWDLLVKNIVPILICILSLASGIFIGNKIGRGESISLYKKDGSNIEFILGPASISNFSLTDLDRSDCAALAERIINLNENNNLAKKLYEASNRHKGIFAIKDFKIAIKFKEADNKINGDNGAACHNSELYKKHLILNIFTNFFFFYGFRNFNHFNSNWCNDSNGNKGCSPTRSMDY